MLYLLGVIFVASSAGRGPGLLTALLSGAAFDYFFIPPRFTFSISDPQHSITFVGFLIVALVTSTFASRAREQASAARRRQAQTAALFDLSRDLAATGLLNPILDVICNFVSQTFSVFATVLLPEEGGHLTLQAATPDYHLQENEIAVADWAFRNGQVAGQGTSTLPAAKAIYLPLQTGRGIVGILGVAPEKADEPLTSEQMRLLEASASLAALAIERALLVQKAQHTVPSSEEAAAGYVPSSI
jgi:two-component system sensor histidine kinase KdpD